MRKIKIKGLETYQSGWKTSFLVSIINKNKDTFKLLMGFYSCRSWMCDQILYQKNSTPPQGPYKFNEKLNMKTGNTYIAVKIAKENVDTFKRNLPWLNKKEEQAGVRKSIIFATQDPCIFVVSGSKYWKDSCWKIMLFTFYIKCMTCTIPENCDKSYWIPLIKNNNEKQLLSKVKINKEIFCPSIYGHNFRRGVHDREGFVSICSGKNPPMAKLLGVTV